MKEDPAVVAQFIKYYRALGAGHMHIYHDGPTDQLSDLRAEDVTITECDDDFWNSRGGRPAGIEERQYAVYREGQMACQTEWMLVVDADEFVFGDRPVAQFLDWLPENVDSVRLPTAEAVWGPGDDINTPYGSSYFRLVWRNDLVWRFTRRLIYGKITPYLRNGLAGHIAGKQFVRTNRRYSRISNHTAERNDKLISVWAASLGHAGSEMYVGHFDAIAYDRWKQKWLRRINGETEVSNLSGTRKSQMRAIAAAFAQGDAASRAIFTELYGLSRSRFRVLTALNCAFRRDIFSPLAWTEGIDTTFLEEANTAHP